MKILVIDVGASKTRSAIYSPGANYSKILKNVEVAATAQGKKEFMAQINAIAERYSGEAEAAAVCLAGMVDDKSGKILNLPNMKFLNDLDIKLELRKYIKNVHIDNDAKCYLRAEAKFGAARLAKNVLLVAMGTGVGGAIMFNREIYYGQGGAGEVGHMVLEEDKTLEMLASGRTALEHRPEDFQRIGKYLGIALANLVNILDPQAIIITGGFGQDMGKRFIPLATKVMKKYIVTPQGKNAVITMGKLGANASLIGAGLLFT